ncbi:hypothetical protein ENBRE01_2912 [Enteropsectra breve]|nr:hypothetical protein ENBRE01_2912 [Enteropsectra breve]
MSNDKTMDTSSLLKGFDMAIMINIVKPFAGTHDEDPKIWLQTFRLLADANKISEEKRPNIFICCLGDTALQWAAEVMDNQDSLTFDSLVETFKTRFKGHGSCERAFNKLYAIKTINNSHDFTMILKEANFLIRSKYLSCDALKDLIAQRLPVHLRSNAREASIINKTWQDYLKFINSGIMPILEQQIPSPQTETRAAIDLGESINYSKIIQNRRPSQYNNTFNQRQQRTTTGMQTCLIHGPGHSSNECRTLNRLKTLGFHVSKKYDQKQAFNMIEKEEAELEYNENKNFNFSQQYNFSSFTGHNGTTRNPFLTQGCIGSNIIRILLDTSADTSVINICFLPEEYKQQIKREKIITKSACGNNLDVLGRLHNLKVTIND